MHLTLAVAPLILTLGSLAPTMCEVPQEIEVGGCLLAHRSVTFSRSSSVRNHRHRLNEQIARHHSWRLEHRKLERAANESQGALDRFIKGQAKSDDACSARLMEAKRALDGLLHDLNSLTQQVKSHEQVLHTETENLNITHLAIDSLDEQFKEDMEQCKAEQEQALADGKDLEKELQELIQIAQPEVRYGHAVGANSTGPQPPEFSLLETNHRLWGLAQCQAFLQLAMDGVLSAPISPGNLSCDTQRQELQDAYTDAVNSVRTLMKDAKDRESDSTCADAAKAKQTSEKVPLIGQRDQASERIASSAQAISLLEPVINMVRNRAEAMEKHIEEALKPECEEVAHVSHTLGTIRNLIISLEKCPGRNDFKLKIPEEAEPATATSTSASTSTTTTSISTTTMSTASTSTSTPNATSSTTEVMASTTTKKTTPTTTKATTTTASTMVTTTRATTTTTTVSTTETARPSRSTIMPIHGPEEPIHGFGGLIPEDQELSALESREDQQDDSEHDEWVGEW